MPISTYVHSPQEAWEKVLQIHPKTIGKPSLNHVESMTWMKASLPLDPTTHAGQRVPYATARLGMLSLQGSS